MKPSRHHRLASMIGVAALAFALPYTAGAALKKEGSWPTVERKVDLHFEGHATDGLKKLARAAGWSLVVANSVAVDGTEDVRVDVQDQPADAVLESLFAGREVVAHRTGSLVTISPGAAHASASPPGAAASGAQGLGVAAAGAQGAEPSAPALAPPPSPPSPPSPPAPEPPAPAAAAQPGGPTPPPVPTVRGSDKNVLGGSLVIHPNEIVHTVTVTGGTLKVEGTVTGDLVVVGGSAKLAKTGRVIGNATVFGGSLKLDKGARIDGDVGLAGGSLKRAEGSVIGGNVTHEDGNVEDPDDAAETDADPLRAEEPTGAVRGRDKLASAGSRISEAAHSFGRSVTRMALLFVLGCVLLALLTPRMEKLRLEIVSRPMRSFALGVAGALLGSLGVLLLVAALCVTVIGIPVAVLGLLVAIVAVYGAVASVLTTFGAAVAGHRTQNPYVHLLIGCGAFLLASSLPWIGGIVTALVVLVAIGALVATRGAGFLDRAPKAFSTGLV